MGPLDLAPPGTHPGWYDLSDLWSRSPFSPEATVCADALPTFGDMQLIGQFSWAGRKYLVYERRD
jgi:hypothetical protein